MGSRGDCYTKKWLMYVGGYLTPLITSVSQKLEIGKSVYHRSSWRFNVGVGGVLVSATE
jgi:hypothetical protein